MVRAGRQDSHVLWRPALQLQFQLPCRQHRSFHLWQGFSAESSIEAVKKILTPELLEDPVLTRHCTLIHGIVCIEGRRLVHRDAGANHPSS